MKDSEMKSIFLIISTLLLLSSISLAQTINIHTRTGTDIYNLADIDSITFTLSDSGFVTDIDGNLYHTIVIGTQEWLVENLKVTHFGNGENIPEVTPDSIWSSLTYGAYCNYGNDPANANIYGRLYNWFALVDSRDIAPIGWHVATDADWQTLVNFLGGEMIAGGALKDTILWAPPNTGGTNSSGFSALPCGYRYFDGGYDNLGYDAHFWSSTENTGSLAWGRLVTHDSPQFNRGSGVKQAGFAVRCVKD